MFVVYLILGLLLIRLMIAALNFFFHPTLPPVNRIKEDPVVSILIIADNESPRIGHLLSQLEGLVYPKLEILIGTYKTCAQTMNTICKYTDRDTRFCQCEVPELKSGWNPYYRVNYLLGRRAKGKYLLFMNPDIELRPGIIETLIGYMVKNKLGMLSVFPHNEIHTFAEWLVFPLVANLYLTLYPLWTVRGPHDPHLAVAGEKFILFDGDVYRQFQPFEEVRGAKDPGRAIARYLKEEGVKIDCLLADTRISLHGCVYWRRCLTQLSHQLLVFFAHNYVFAFVYAIFAGFWFVPFLLVGRFDLLILGVLIWGATRFIVSYIMKRSFDKNLLYAFPQAIALMVIIWVSLIHEMHKRRWRKRKEKSKRKDGF